MTGDLGRDRRRLVGQVPGEHGGEHGDDGAGYGTDRRAGAHERSACRIAAFRRSAGIGPFTCGGITFPDASTKNVSG